MKWLNCAKTKVLLFVFVAAIVLCGGIVKADFVIGERVKLEALRHPSTTSFKGWSFSHDGLRLYQADDRTGGYGGRDIWLFERESPDAPWGEAFNLGSNVNSAEFEEGWPTISPDDLELYFGFNDGSTWQAMRSTRASKDEPWGPAAEYNGVYPDEFSSDGLTKYTEAEWDGGYGGSDIWATTRATIDDDWGETVNLGPNVNNSVDQYGPSISSDGLALFFSSRIPPQHIHMCIRATTEDEWGPAVELGPSVNNYAWSIQPEISPDGSTLYFHPGGGVGLSQVSIKPIVDFNGDGNINTDDLLIMIDNWGSSESLCDIGPMPWGDGVVDIKDLEVFVEHLFPDPVACWKLDETGGDIAYDSAGEHDATIYGEPTWQPQGGMVDGALELDGIDDYVKRAFVLDTDPFGPPFSVFLWAKGGAPGQVIFSQANKSDWLAIDSTDGSLITELKFIGKPSQTLSSQVVITDGQWHRVGLVWDGINRILYVDDVEVASDTYAAGPLIGDLQIGAGNKLEAGTFWSGLIDDVRIYKRAITP